MEWRLLSCEERRESQPRGRRVPMPACRCDTEVFFACGAARYHARAPLTRVKIGLHPGRGQSAGSPSPASFARQRAHVTSFEVACSAGHRYSPSSGGEGGKESQSLPHGGALRRPGICGAARRSPLGVGTGQAGAADVTERRITRRVQLSIGQGRGRGSCHGQREHGLRDGDLRPIHDIACRGLRRLASPASTAMVPQCVGGLQDRSAHHRRSRDPR